MVEDTRTPKEAPERKRLSEELDEIYLRNLRAVEPRLKHSSANVIVRLSAALKRVLAVTEIEATGQNTHGAMGSVAENAGIILGWNLLRKDVREAIDAE